MTFALILYFSVNSKAFLEVLHPILAEVLPGEITLEKSASRSQSFPDSHGRSCDQGRKRHGGDYDR